MSDQAGFDRDAAERVLRRAIDLAELDVLAPSRQDISEQALAEAAEDLGLDVAAVRLAAAEERLGVLAQDSSNLDRVAGPAVVSATRMIERPASELVEVVDQWLRRHGALRRRRLDERSLFAEYSRRSDPMAWVQRGARAVRGREHLRRVRRLRVVVQPVDTGRSVVALVADLQMERTAAVTGGSTVAGVGSAVSVLEVASSTAWWWLGVPASAAVGLGMVRQRARGVPDVEAALQGVLDRVVAGEADPGRLAEVRGRLLGGLPRPAGRTAHRSPGLRR